ncbi:hypothetical protein ACFL6B_01885 [Thermodesulfobacteriota bacterium]
MFDQTDLKPIPHWSKSIFKRHNVPINAVARYLNLSFHYVSGMLSGICRVTPENEEKLRKLVKRIEEDLQKCEK